MSETGFVNFTNTFWIRKFYVHLLSKHMNPQVSFSLNKLISFVAFVLHDDDADGAGITIFKSTILVARIWK